MEQPRQPFRFLRYAIVGVIVGPIVMFVFSFIGIGLGLGQERNQALILLVVGLMFLGVGVAVISALYLLGWLLYWLVGRL